MQYPQDRQNHRHQDKKGGAQVAEDVEGMPDGLSDKEREERSVGAIRHLSLEITELVALRGKSALARSILGHAPPCAAVRKALLALEGRTLEEIADVAEHAPTPDEETGRGVWRDGWEAGWHAGYEIARQRGGQASEAAA